MKKRILFIINPVSGVRSKESIPEIINQQLDCDKYDFTIQFTERAGHAPELAESAVKKNYDIVVAVGGDGTLNEVARTVTGTDTVLGIIPLGSGNGLARHLGIPLKVSEAIRVINRCNTQSIDVCKLNDHLFFSNAGAGFVADVVHSFHGEKMRGFPGYAFHVIKVFFGYRSVNYSLIVDGENYEGQFFLVNISNSNQFGYNVKIAPQAELTDGLMDLVLIKSKPKLFMIPSFIALLNGRIHRNKNVTVKKVNQIKFSSVNNMRMQIDGEPIIVSGDIYFSILTSSLKVICQ